MHIFFSGIGGTAIGPLALIAKEAGYNISGSDTRPSQYIEYLKEHGVTDIHVGPQTYDQIAAIHATKPIDWFVYTSALPLEQPDAEELRFCRDQDIKTSKRDELLNFILKEKKLQLIAAAGTHGKTTTTAMIVWLFMQLKLPISYSVGAKISFGHMGWYEPESKYFVYEADEFDRNFLEFEPRLSAITGVSWDHHEIFPTREDYQAAFREFISQSEQAIIWQEDADYLNLDPADPHIRTEDSSLPEIEGVALDGRYNRLDAWLAIEAVHSLTNAPVATLIKHIEAFPGLQRRMEELAPDLFTDYAHTPDKIRGAMSVAMEIARKRQKRLVVLYEPLTNRRQHYMKDDYKDVFAGAAKVYWLPSYLAREDPKLRIIPPAELISNLSDPSVAEPAEQGEALKQAVQKHLAQGDMVVGMAGGGGSSLDEWLRAAFTSHM